VVKDGKRFQPRELRPTLRRLPLAPMAQPEWPGAASSRFADKCTGKHTSRRLIDSDCRNGDHTSLAKNGFGNYFSDTAGLIPATSKRIIGCSPSDVQAWRPARRSISEPGVATTMRAEGRRTVEPPSGEVFSTREKRHLRQVGSKEEHNDRPVGPKAVYRDNSLRAADQPAKEIDISAEMQLKARNLHMHTQRNQIGCRSLGDKNYRHPDYEQHFFKAGEMVVGSSFARGSHKKHLLSNSTVFQSLSDAQRKREDKEKVLSILKQALPALSAPQVKAEFETMREASVNRAQFERARAVRLSSLLTEICEKKHDRSLGWFLETVRNLGGEDPQVAERYKPISKIISYGRNLDVRKPLKNVKKPADWDTPMEADPDHEAEVADLTRIWELGTLKEANDGKNVDAADSDEDVDDENDTGPPP